MTPAKNKKKKQLDVSSQSDNSPSAQLMSYILEEKRNEKQQQLSSQPLHHQVHPVDAFLSGISHTLKTLNPLQLNEASSTTSNMSSIIFGFYISSKNTGKPSKSPDTPKLYQ